MAFNNVQNTEIGKQDGRFKLIPAKLVMRRTRIEKAADLVAGDHIAWHRPAGYWHHAIYLGQSPACLTPSTPPTQTIDGRECSFSGGCNSPPNICCRGCYSCDSCWSYAWPSRDTVNVISYKFDKTHARVVESTEWFNGIEVYRIEYDDCYDAEYTVELAKKAVTAAKQTMTGTVVDYDVLLENCEHFSRRCKTGRSESNQVLACRAVCRRNFLMSLLRLIPLIIWAICEAEVGDHEVSIGDEERQDLTKIELHISITLSVFFSFIYCSYVILSDCRSIRRAQSPSGLEEGPVEEVQRSDPGPETSDQPTKRHSCPRLKYFAYLCFQIPNLLFREAIHSFRKNSKRFCDRDTIGDRLDFFCRNYCNIVVRVFVAELISIGWPIVAFYLFQSYHQLKDVVYSDALLAFIGFLISLVVTIPSVMLGGLVGNLSGHFFLVLYLCFVKIRRHK